MTANLVLLLIISLSLYGRSQQNVFSVKPKSIIAKLGFPARLDCQTNISRAFIRWAYGGNTTTALSPAECNCVTLSNSSLYFNQTTHATGGDYTCIVVGAASGQINGSITIAINPEITPSGFSMTRNQNETFTLNINVTGTPLPDVTWLKDSANFTSELTGVTVTMSGLQVTNAQYATAGRYRVQATNCANTDSQTYDIFIRSLPIITMTRNLDSKEVPVGTTVIVTCSVMSYPGSSIHWEQQTANKNIPLNEFTVMNDTSNMFSVITNSTFMFTSEQINGASKFCCAATNAIGTMMQCLEFTEHGAPPPPSGFNAIERTPSSITVQWDPPSLDLVTHDLWYRVENSNQSWNMTNLQNGETRFKLDNLRPNTSYILRITALSNSIRSLPTPLITRTRISVPGDVLSFKVDSTLNPGTFVLTWQAPKDSVVDCYIVYIRGPNDYNRMMKVNGAKTGVNINDLSENVEYMFAVQAINDGGNGSISSYRSGVFCFMLPKITAQYQPHGTTVNVSWDLSDSVYSSRNVMLIVAEQSKAAFTSELINASYRQHCVTNLKPSTRYEIMVIAILNCDNVSSELDVLTQAPMPVTTFPSQNCLVYNVTNVESLSEEADSGRLEAWVIVLIVLLPLLAVVVMMSIGIYCACKKRYTSKDPELPPVTNTSSQAPLSHHTRNPSTSSYTGSFASGATTPIRSPSSYHSRGTGYRPAHYNGRIDEQQSLGQHY